MSAVFRLSILKPLLRWQQQIEDLVMRRMKELSRSAILKPMDQKKPKTQRDSDGSGILTTVELRLDFRSPGRLNRWLGPALRGVISKRLKNHWCHWEPAIRDQSFSHCTGCRYQPHCTFANLLEPAPAPSVIKGWQAAPHRLVIAPDFPVRTYARGDGTDPPLDFRLMVYDALDDWLTPILTALIDAGQSAGLGEDHVQFEVKPLRICSDGGLHDRLLRVMNSPMEENAAVRVSAITPTMLKRDGQLVRSPHFFDFLSASLRLLRAVLGDKQPLGSLFSGFQTDHLKHLASGVGISRQAWQFHRPPRNSSRSGERYLVDSITGWGEFSSVPSPLIELVRIAGNLGIGSQRVCGAGQVRCE